MLNKHHYNPKRDLLYGIIILLDGKQQMAWGRTNVYSYYINRNEKLKNTYESVYKSHVDRQFRLTAGLSYTEKHYSKHLDAYVREETK